MLRHSICAILESMKFSICNEVFGQSQSLENWKTICEYSRSVGYDGIEIAPFTFAENVKDISQTQRAEIKKIAGDNGLKISGLHWLLVSPPGLQINAIDENLRAQTIDYLRALIDFAGDVGGR